MNPDQFLALRMLIDHLEEDIRYLSNSRILHLTPGERSRRIRLRQFWIQTIKELAPEIEVRQ